MSFVNVLYNIAQSAKFRKLRPVFFLNHLYVVWDNNGPNTDPCGTPSYSDDIVTYLYAMAWQLLTITRYYYNILDSFLS